MPARCLLLAFVVVLFRVGASFGETLPEQHPYQKTLRAYLATLAEKDFEIKPVERPARAEITDDERFVDWLWMDAGESPRFDDVNVPASAYTLEQIESKAVMRPAGNADTAAFLATWDHPSNPFFNSRALRLRAIVVASVDMVMLDALHEQVPSGEHSRSDYLGGTLIWLATAYKAAKTDMPVEAQKAYETGLRKLVDRLVKWGPKGYMTDMDLFASVSLWLAADALDDEAMRKTADDYCKVLYSDPRFFNEAGYFVDCGCFDASYNGISLYFAGWAARVSGRPYITKAVTEAYRLRAFLSLPEPDGRTYVGPTHFNSRTSGDSPNDQWGWMSRRWGGVMATDDLKRPIATFDGKGKSFALASVTMPPASDLATASARLEAMLRNAAWPAVTDEAGKKPAPPASKPWTPYHWTSFNHAAATTPPAFYTTLKELYAQSPGEFTPPFVRYKEFEQRFGDAFYIAKKRAGFGIILHTGPVAGDDGRWHRPFGFGGGALSAFWTPDTGPVILGRRRGIQGRTFDTYDDWRVWPTHAITGVTEKGPTISSARTPQPKVTYDIGAGREAVTIEGEFTRTSDQGLPFMPSVDPVAPRGEDAMAPTQILTGKMTYRRVFTLHDDGLAIESSFTADGKDKIAELYEVLPVYLGDGYENRPASEPAVRILFKSKTGWTDAAAKTAEGVSDVRVERKKGAIEITFDRPVRARLSPGNWVDGYFSSATLRNVMIDLLDQSNSKGAISYRIAPAKTAAVDAK